MSDQDDSRLNGNYSVPVPPGMTRNCLDAWCMAFVQVDGAVRLCCYSGPVGNLTEKPLDEVLNSPQAIAYREGLLTGNPLPICANCPDKRVCTTQELEARVSHYLNTGETGSDGTGL